MRKYLFILSLIVLAACATDEVDETPGAWSEDLSYTVINCNATLMDSESALEAVLIATYGSTYDAQISNLKVVGTINGEYDFVPMRTFKRLDLSDAKIIGEFNISATATDTGDGGTITAKVGDASTATGENIVDEDGGDAIPEEAFCYKESSSDETALVEITLPSTVRSIGKSAFWRCEKLKNVYIGKVGGDVSELSIIYGGAFYGCKKLVKFGPAKSTYVEEFDFPESLTQIKDSAFKECTSLDNVTFLNNLSVLGAQAFQGCATLRSINIPSSVEEIGSVNVSYGSNTDIPWSSDTFRYCSSLTNITVNWTSGTAPLITASTFPEHFRTKNWSNAIYVAGSGNIDDGITSVYTNDNNWSYYFLTGSENYTISKENTEINTIIASTIVDDALAGNSYSTLFEQMEEVYGENFTESTVAFTNLTITGEITSDDFKYMQVFKNVNLQGVTGVKGATLEGGAYTTRANEIPTRSFEGNNNLINFYLPNYDMSTIGSYAFANCDNLYRVVFADTTNSLKSYVQTIGSYAFYNCPSLYTSISLPDDTSYSLSVGISAFENCPQLQGVTFNAKTIGVDFEIGASAFKNCTSLTSLTLPNSITEIGSSAFDGCSAITAITTDWSTDTENSATVPNIDESSFPSQFKYGTVDGKYITFPATMDGAYNGSTGWYAYALKDATSLVDINKNVVYTVPGDLGTKITNYVTNCRTSDGAILSLSQMVTIENSSQALAVGDIQSLEEQPLEFIDLSQVYRVVAGYMNSLNGCETLKKIKLNEKSNSLTNMGDDGAIFKGCVALEAMWLPWGEDEVPAVDSSAFVLENEVTAYIPAGTKDAYKAKGWTSATVANLTLEELPAE